MYFQHDRVVWIRRIVILVAGWLTASLAGWLLTVPKEYQDISGATHGGQQLSWTILGAACLLVSCSLVVLGARQLGSRPRVTQLPVVAWSMAVAALVAGIGARVLRGDAVGANIGAGLYLFFGVPILIFALFIAGLALLQMRRVPNQRTRHGC